MSAYDGYLPDPLWFARSELLAELFHAELNIVNSLLTESPDLLKLFDAAEASVSQRSMCVVLLAHRKLVEMIDEMFVQRYEDAPSLTDLESNALKRTNNLVAGDAPVWVLEIDKMVELLPSRILEALPEPLRREGFYRNTPAEDEAVKSAAETLSTVAQIQAMTQQVFDQQLKRLETRWSTTFPAATATTESPSHVPQQLKQRTSKTIALRKRDAQRIKREELIAEIAEVTKTPAEFLQMMDERKVQPQPTWNWPGSWTQAYKHDNLRKLIHQDKSRAVIRVRARHSR